MKLSNKGNMIMNIESYKYCNNSFQDFLQSQSIVQSAMGLIKKNAKSLDFYEYHFIPCTKVCYDLAGDSEEDKLDAVLLGLFHDYGKFFIRDIDNHEIIGAEKAKEFLISNGYDYVRTIEIVEAIKNHKGNANDKSISNLSKIIINADSISYIQQIDYFLNYLIDNGCSREQAEKITEEKIKHNKDRMDSSGHNYLQSLIKEEELRK